VPQRPIRPLAVVGVLALGDYLLWNWSLGANHDVVALVAGMTLIPLLIALAWLVVVAIARLLAHAAQRPRTGAGARAGGSAAGRDARAGGRSGGSRAGIGARATVATAAAATTAAEPHPALGDPTPAAATAASPSSKLAA
jgi:hypothetical protein